MTPFIKWVVVMRDTIQQNSLKGELTSEPDTLTISKIPIQPKVWADGGTITEADGFRIHTFFLRERFIYTREDMLNIY